MTNRVIIVLLVLAVSMQATTIYRSYHKSVPPTGTAIRDAPTNSFMDLAGLPMRGVPTSSIVLVEFSDYECPFCSRYAKGVGRTIQQKYVETGQVQYAFANNPLPIHSSARRLAIAAICLGLQDRFWDMHDLIFEAAPRTPEQILDTVSRLNLDSREFKTCQERSESVEQQIEHEVVIASQLGLRGTPAFAVGTIVSPGRARIHKLIVGAQPERVFAEAIRAVKLPQ